MIGAPRLELSPAVLVALWVGYCSWRRWQAGDVASAFEVDVELVEWVTLRVPPALDPYTAAVSVDDVRARGWCVELWRGGRS